MKTTICNKCSINHTRYLIIRLRIPTISLLTRFVRATSIYTPVYTFIIPAVKHQIIIRRDAHSCDKILPDSLTILHEKIVKFKLHRFLQLLMVCILAHQTIKFIVHTFSMSTFKIIYASSLPCAGLRSFRTGKKDL